MGRKYFKANETKYTQKLADYATNLKFEQIPPEVIERAKMMTLHTLGVSLAAKPIELSEATVKVARAINGGSGGNASVWTTGEQLSMVSASFANGTLADMLDWEDCAWTGHPSAGVIPSAMAVAEALKKDGKSYLEAVVAAYEVYARAAMAVQPPSDFDHNKGWALGTWQIFAATTPAAKLLGLDSEKMNQAFGMSVLFATMPTNLQQATMSNAYHYQHGIAAQNGVLAALCAQNGVENLKDCFDIPYAYCEQLTSKVEREWLDKNLENEFYMMQILIKHWPANMWVNTPVEIVDLLVKENNIVVDDIAEIIVDPPTQYRMHFFEEGFESLMEAQFSMPYVIGALLVDPNPGPNWYTKEMFTNPKLMEYAKKVKSGPSKEHTLTESFNIYQDGSHPEKTVTILMKDGSKYQKTQRTHKGHPLDMLTREEFCDLFRREASFALPSDKIEKIIDFVLSLEEVEDMSVIHELLS